MANNKSNPYVHSAKKGFCEGASYALAGLLVGAVWNYTAKKIQEHKDSKKESDSKD